MFASLYSKGSGFTATTAASGTALFPFCRAILQRQLRDVFHRSFAEADRFAAPRLRLNFAVPVRN